MYLIKNKNGFINYVADGDLQEYLGNIQHGVPRIESILHLDDSEEERVAAETARFLRNSPMSCAEMNDLTELTIYANRISKILSERFGTFSFLMVDGMGTKSMHLITDSYLEGATVKDSKLDGYFTAEFKCNDCEVETFGREFEADENRTD